MKLYTYYRSQASFRVRIALNLKEQACDGKSGPLMKYPSVREIEPPKTNWAICSMEWEEE